MIAQHRQEAQFFLADGEIRGRDIDGQGISGLTQFGTERFADEAEDRFETFLVLQDLAAFLRDMGELVGIKGMEDRQLLDDAADRFELAVAQMAFDGCGRQDRSTRERTCPDDG